MIRVAVDPSTARFSGHRHTSFLTYVKNTITPFRTYVNNILPLIYENKICTYVPSLFVERYLPLLYKKINDKIFEVIKQKKSSCLIVKISQERFFVEIIGNFVILAQ